MGRNGTLKDFVDGLFPEPHDPRNTERLRRRIEAASGASPSPRRARKGIGEAGQPHRGRTASSGRNPSRKSVVARALSANHNAVHGPPIPVGSSDTAKAESRRRLDPGQHLLKRFLDGRKAGGS